MIRAVVFDMDGVLTDSESVINAAAIAGLREFGVAADPEDFLPFVGMGEDRYIGGVAEKYGVPFVPEMKRRVYEIYLEILPKMLRPFPGARDLVKRLYAAGIPLAVASSADRIKVEANLRAAGIPIERFSAVVAGEDVPRKKPDPAIFRIAAERLHLGPSQCCVVEDAPSGIQAAKRAGMRCVAVAQTFPPERLVGAEPDRIRPTVADIEFHDLGLAQIPR